MSLQMHFEQHQNLKQMQRLMMSPQMQQAIAIMQMPLTELIERVELEIAQNPMLENLEIGIEEENLANEETITEPLPEEEFNPDLHDLSILRQLSDDMGDIFQQHLESDDPYTERDKELHSFIENSITSPQSLFEFLMSQAKETFESKDELAFAELIIGNLDKTGFFTDSLIELALLNGIDIQKLQKVLIKIQQFEPSGIAALNLQHSLLLQLKRKNKTNSVAYKLLEDGYEDLLHNRLPELQKKFHYSLKQIQHAIDKDIRILDFHPGTAFTEARTSPLIADASIILDDGAFIVSTQMDKLPSCRINRSYLKMLDDPSLPSDTREYIQQKLLSARWFFRSLQRRCSTIEEITIYLAKFQSAFFMEIDGQLRPLNMATIAECLDLNPSTIARAIANKYIDTPRGLLALRSFFTNAYETENGNDISASSVKQTLMNIINTEDKNDPHSDELLSKMLMKQGIACARRTVAKYRTLSGIGNAHQRRKYSENTKVDESLL